MGCLYSVFDVKKQGKPAWVVQTRNWKLWGVENRLSGLLEGVSVSGNVFTWLSSDLMMFGGLDWLTLESKWLWFIPYMIHGYEWYGIGKRNEMLALRGSFLKPCDGLERGIPQALLQS
ncbi:hypothetical protein GQ457_03G020490 [Hibiscus cannabinus]